MEYETLDHLDDMTFDEVLSRAVAAWEESRKNRNQLMAEDRAEQESIFRDVITSKKSEKTGKSEKFFWITINPKEDITLPQLIKVQQKMIKKKWIQTYAYVYETTVNKHIHTHTLLRSDYEPARARKEIANTIKDICNVAIPACFKFVIVDEDQAREKLAYMLGKKKKGKMESVELTKKWREENLLKEIYSSEVPISCWDLGNVISQEPL